MLSKIWNKIRGNKQPSALITPTIRDYKPIPSTTTGYLCELFVDEIDYIGDALDRVQDNSDRYWMTVQDIFVDQSVQLETIASTQTVLFELWKSTHHGAEPTINTNPEMTCFPGSVPYVYPLGFLRDVVNGRFSTVKVWKD